jgi:D-methionine transport system permease protein
VKLIEQLVEATLETLYMLFFSGALATLLGIPLGIMLYMTNNANSGKRFYPILDTVVNIFRSIPFIILVLLLIPVTKEVVGTIIGPTAAVFNLTIAAIPFMGRLVENSLKSIPNGIIDSANCLGVNKRQLIFRVLIPETLPEQINNITVMLINLVTYTAIAGAVGAGGLGQLAINYGYYRFEWQMVFYAVIILVALSQFLQWIGTKLSTILKH